MDYVPILDFDINSRMDTNYEILHELEEDILIMYIVMLVACDTQHLFNPNELEEGG